MERRARQDDYALWGSHVEKIGRGRRAPRAAATATVVTQDDIKRFAETFYEALEQDLWGGIDPYLFKLIAQGDTPEAEDVLSLTKAIRAALGRQG